ncbi:MAG: beta-lactamase family protein [Proteobacteria bacterium]|nr:beta-lactamase family protein [Pseudomonadota bacterium]
MTIPFDGTCDPKFVRVREAFENNFVAHGEPGAAVAVSLHGKPVVDIWGGWKDRARTQPWQRDTLVNFFSVSKALCTVCVLRLVESGQLDLDAPVANYWPEFAQGGKQAITTRQVLSHRAGLPAIRETLQDGAMLDWALMTGALARTKPWWEPGTAHGYHVNTFGFLAGEIVRRICGKSIGAALREEIAKPLDADVHIGLPLSEHARAAEYLWPASSGAAQGMPDADQEMRWKTYWNPPGFSGAGWVNTPQWRSAEIPSTNGHGTARGVARFYSALASGGAIDGVHILSKGTLKAATVEHSAGFDLINQRPSRFGLGFQLTQPERPLGPNPGAFGHFGAGGSLGYCDPEAGIAFAYVTNDMGPRWQNPRNRALIDAVYASL